MLRRKVKLIIFKEDAIRVIDALSLYGTVKVDSVKDKSIYHLSVACDCSEFPKCLESVLRLSSEGVDIRRPNISYTL